MYLLVHICMFLSGDISFKSFDYIPPFQILKNLLKERDSFILFTLIIYRMRRSPHSQGNSSLKND